MPQLLTFPFHSVFLAIPLKDQAKWQFQVLQQSLKPFEDILSFQNTQSPHLTLQFWPEVMKIEYTQILEQCRQIAAKATPFTLKIEGIGTFGSRGEDRVLFLDVPFSDELARLRKLCPWPLGQPFSPHVTLARIRHPQRFVVVKKKVLKALGNIQYSMNVDLLRLYAEVDGRKQTAMNEWKIGKGKF